MYCYNALSGLSGDCLINEGMELHLSRLITCTEENAFVRCTFNTASSHVIP